MAQHALAAMRRRDQHPRWPGHACELLAIDPPHIRHIQADESLHHGE